MDTNIDVPDGPSNATNDGFWGIADQGYDSDLGNSENYGIGFGYKVNPLISLELNYNYRPSFSYSKYQTSSTPSKIQTRTRYFDLENQSLMVNSVIHLNEISDSLQYSAGSFKILPFIEAGVGVSRNKVSNFHSIASDGTEFSNKIRLSLFLWRQI